MWGVADISLDLETPMSLTINRLGQKIHLDAFKATPGALEGDCVALLCNDHLRQLGIDINHANETIECQNVKCKNVPGHISNSVIRNNRLKC